MKESETETDGVMERDASACIRRHHTFALPHMRAVRRYTAAAGGKRLAEEAVVSGGEKRGGFFLDCFEFVPLNWR